ncbi:hypothetical protein K501DRAFT_218903 [Backusella circina FSU 941]|nr:hypothetical protein K501DRAFT_218903 [Backusella circina FSU 941]
MSAIKPSSLKVVELRQELSKRGLATKGKKDELVARLTEALAAENSTQEQQESQLEQQQTEVSPSTEAVVNKEEQAAEKSTESKPVNKPVEEETSAIEKHSDTISTHQSSDTPSAKESTEGSHDQPMKEAVEIAQVDEKSVENDQTMEETNETSANDMKEKEESKPTESSTIANQSDQKQKEEVSAYPTDVSTNNPADETTNDDTTLKRKAETIDEEKPEKKAKTNESNDDEIKSSAIFVKGFVRPLIIRQVQDLFGKYGNIKRFWMDTIKTHCYVMYETDAEANEAFSKVNGITFPPDTGKTLSVGGLTSEQAEQLIGFEQSAAERRIRVDWEANIEKVKAGEELVSTPDSSSRKTRTMGIGQIAKQLAQAATPAVTASRTPTPTTEKAQSDSNLALEDLFKKTKALPALYYLPVSEEVAKERLARLLK